MVELCPHVVTPRITLIRVPTGNRGTLATAQIESRVNTVTVMKIARGSP